jgi:hypothetical protein
VGVKLNPSHPGKTVNENRVLRRIFGPERDEARGGWRKLHNESSII